MKQSSSVSTVNPCKLTSTAVLKRYSVSNRMQISKKFGEIRKLFRPNCTDTRDSSDKVVWNSTIIDTQHRRGYTGDYTHRMQYGQGADFVARSDRDKSTGMSRHRRRHEQRRRLPVAAMFPEDPRDWARDDVISWLLWATDNYKLGPVDVEKFHMNGKGLIYLNKDGFERRAPSAGDKLFQDFRVRFARAIMAEKNAHCKV